MKFYPRLFSALFCLLIFSSCGNEEVVFTEYTDIPSETWNWDNPALFEFEITDDQTTYNKFINLRLTDAYPKANIYILAELANDQGDTLEKPYNLKLFSEEGSTLGKKSGKLMNYKVPIDKSNQILKKGKYKLKFIQHTRVFELKGVNAVGFTLEKGEPVF